MKVDVKRILENQQKQDITSNQQKISEKEDFQIKYKLDFPLENSDMLEAFNNKLENEDTRKDFVSTLIKMNIKKYRYILKY